MRMVPSSPYQTGSRAEKRVFDRLRDAFDGSDGESLVAFHSLNLPKHPSQRFGEADFVLCGPRGLFVLEVKGGGVTCRDGKWETIDRSGRRHFLRRSPFQQAEDALHAIRRKLCEWAPDADRQLVFGYGVVFPDCKFDVQGSEWDRRQVADTRDMRDFESWLSRLFRYWEQKSFGNGRPDSSLLKRMKRFLRPEFEKAMPLHVQVGYVEKEVATLTEEQMRFLDMIDANPRVLCEGGAGTGKTFLGMELARRWAGKNWRVALICQSPWLKCHLESAFAISGVSVVRPEGLKVAARREGIERFDALIVDEGQDLFSLDALDRLDGVLVGGLAGGRWCIFHDVNNQSGFFGEVDYDALRYLESLGAAKVPLRTNCRNTQVILDKVKTDLGADMGVKGVGHGPPVREHHAADPEEAARILVGELKEIIDDGGICAGDVTILSPLRFGDSCVSLLPPAFRNRIVVLDEFSMRSFPPEQTSFSEIGAFKGLENEAIVLVDLPPRSEMSDDLRNRYVGMSRARAVLSVIYGVRDQNGSQNF